MAERGLTCTGSRPIDDHDPPLAVDARRARLGRLLALIPLAACGPPESDTLRGHGFGHGRGLSQWAALGNSERGWVG